MNSKGEFHKCLPIFNALGSAVRQKILFTINEEKNLGVHCLAERINLSRPTVSHHLGILQDAGIIHHRKVGRECIYYLSFEDALHNMTRLISSVEKTKS